MLFGLFWYPVFRFQVVRFNGPTVNDLYVIPSPKLIQRWIVPARKNCKNRHYKMKG